MMTLPRDITEDMDLGPELPILECSKTLSIFKKKLLEARSERGIEALRSQIYIFIKKENSSYQKKEKLPFHELEDQFEQIVNEMVRQAERLGKADLLIEARIFPYTGAKDQLVEPMYLYPQAIKSISIHPGFDPIDRTIEEIKNVIGEIKLEDHSQDFANIPGDPIDFFGEEIGSLISLQKVQKTLDLNSVKNTRDLMELLGTRNPTYNDWRRFVDRLNAIKRSDSISYWDSMHLLKWMRKKRLLPDLFKDLQPTNSEHEQED